MRLLRLHLSALLLTAVIVAGCEKKKPVVIVKPTPPTTVVATPTPTPEPTPTPVVQSNKDAQVIVLCYHRFEDRPKDSLAIKPSEFEEQMEILKKDGITVIPMQDFLAWRRNEKVIPNKSAVISIDDGYLSGYEVAWPILKKHDYPFTMFVYTNYIKGGANSGGKSMSWEQLEEMRDAGVDIQSHTVSHSDLRSKKSHPNDYEKWLDSELGDSKRMIENQLGTQVRALAYPYGLNNEVVREAGLKAGYEALFTVYGQTICWGGEPGTIGRFAIESTHPQIFANAIKFQAPYYGQRIAASPGAGTPVNSEPSSGAAESPVTAQLASASMITEPENGVTISDEKPLVRANLATMGELDPASVQMLISGFGIVPAKYDPATKMISYQIDRPLQAQLYKVIVEGRVKGKKVETQWSFIFAR